MSLVLSVLFVLLPWQYPFEPIQMTVFSCSCVGIPSFILALEPNHDVVRGHFLANCIVKSFPGAFCAILGILAISIVGNCFLDLTINQIQTCSLIALCFLGVLLIIRISIPYTPIRAVLTACILLALCFIFTFMRPIFDIAVITPEMAIMLLCVCAINFVLYNLLFNRLVAWQKKSIIEEQRGIENHMTRMFKRYF